MLGFENHSDVFVLGPGCPPSSATFWCFATPRQNHSLGSPCVADQPAFGSKCGGISLVDLGTAIYGWSLFRVALSSAVEEEQEDSS